jgi:polyisoprenyl-phosphate glycosyltransferase
VWHHCGRVQQPAGIVESSALPKVSIVVPVYRSEASLPSLVQGLFDTAARTGRQYELVLVDDCSPDRSWDVLQRLKAEHPAELKIARLMRNSGQHTALLCGLSLATGDVVVTMDDDLQNPPDEVPRLVASVEQGFDLAIGSYPEKQHSRFRNLGGRLIDTLLRRIFGLPGDFQLTSFRAARAAVARSAVQMGGVYPYITAMLLAHASKAVNVPVRHEPRRFGQSNYSLKRSLQLAANLIFSYSSYPLYFTAAICLGAFGFALVYGLVTLNTALRGGTAVPGWASTMVVMSFFNAALLLCITILTLYISRIGQQVTRSRLEYPIGELRD